MSSINILYRIQMFKISKTLCFTIALFGLLLFNLGQAQTQISLNQEYDIALDPNSPKIWILTIDQDIQPSQQLFIQGYSPVADPTQQPQLKISYGNNQQQCFPEIEQLNDVCLLTGDNVKKGSKIKITVTCLNDCSAKLYAYISQTIQLELGESQLIRSGSKPIQKIVKIDISHPQGSLLWIMMKNSTSPYQVFINYGNNPSIPTKDNHMNVTHRGWGLTKQYMIMISPMKTIVLVYLSIEPFNLVEISANYLRNGVNLVLGSEYEDYCQEGIEKSYSLKLDDNFFEGYVLDIYISVYSGDPTIKVSFDENFTSEDTMDSNHGTFINYEVSNTKINASEFKGYVYLKISGSSTFVIKGTSTKKEAQNHKVLKVGSIAYLEIDEATQIVTFIDYVYQTDLIQYHIKIDEFQGPKTQIDTYICNTANSTDETLCYADNTIDLTRQQFISLPTQVSLNDVTFEIDPKLCYTIENAGYSKCQTIITVAPTQQNQHSKLSLTVNKERLPIRIKQGQTYFGFLKQDYSYYLFYLPVEAKSIKQVVIFLNTIGGSPILLSSRNDPSPTLQEYKANGTDIIMSQSYISYGITNNLTIYPFYIGVYGKQYSEFALTVSLHHKNSKDSDSSNESQGKDIQLNDGVTLQFDLPIQKTISKFIFTPKNDGNIDIRIVELLGRINADIIFLNDNSKPDCENNKYCTLYAKQNEPIRIIVKGTRDVQQQFVITIVQEDHCYQYPIGTPLFASFVQNQTDCLQIRLNRNSPVEIATSINQLKMLEKPIEINIQVITLTPNATSSSVMSMDTSSMRINIEEIIKDINCEQGNCYLNISMHNGAGTIRFQMTVQYLDGILKLYDGISQPILSPMAITDSKKFRYYIASQNQLQIFLNTKQDQKYKVKAKMVSRGDYMLSRQSLFPTSQEQDGEFMWSVAHQNDSNKFLVITIPRAEIKEKIEKLGYGYMLITVSLIEKTEEMCDFSLQISQRERMLKEGETLLGYLQLNQMVMYELYGSQDSYLEVNIVNVKRGMCLNIRNQNHEKIQGLTYRFNGTRKDVEYIYLTSRIRQGCIYQISLQKYTQSVLQITEGFTHHFTGKHREKTHFLYYHNRDVSFKILEFIEAGNSIIYVSPLFTKETMDVIKNGLDKMIESMGPQDYQYIGKESKYLQIRKQSTGDDRNVKYCFQCYYLITIEADPFVKEEIMVVPFDSTPILKETAVVDDVLLEGQTDTFIVYMDENVNYFYSADAIYGSIQVTVREYNNSKVGDILATKIVSESTQIIEVQIDQTKVRPTPSLFHQLSKYSVSVKGLTKSGYHLQMNRQYGIFHVVEGITTGFNLDLKHQNATFYFSNNPEEKKKMNVLIHYEHYFPKSYVVVGIIGHKQQALTPTIRSSGKLQSISLPKDYEVYFVYIQASSITSKEKVTITIPRHNLMELSPNFAYVMSHQAIYQIYIPEKNRAVIELFDCSQNVFIRGSVNYDDLTSGKITEEEVQLLHQNIGGHYVIHTNHLTGIGVYYLRVQSKEYNTDIKEKLSENIEYLIRHVILPEDIYCPYMYIDLPNDKVSYDVDATWGNTTFMVKALKTLNEQKVILNKVRYYLVIAEKEENILKRYMCFDKKYHVLFSSSIQVQDDQENILINISKSAIHKAVGAKESYIGAIAVAEAVSGDRKFQDITYIYDPTHVQKFDKTTIMTPFSFLAWALLALIIIGGIIFTYTLIVNLVRIYRGYQSQMMELNEEGSTMEGVGQYSNKNAQQLKQKQEDN